MYLKNEEIREFEEKFGYKELNEKNKLIGKELNFEPLIEYAICDEGACCYSPSNVGNFFTNWQSQKAECDRWLDDNNKRFPDGWVAKGNYKTTKLEYYPSFHLNWNHLMEAIKRLNDRGAKVTIYPDDIFGTWVTVAGYCT